jgi:hypothetical protein
VREHRKAELRYEGAREARREYAGYAVVHLVAIFEALEAGQVEDARRMTVSALETWTGWADFPDHGSRQRLVSQTWEQAAAWREEEPRKELLGRRAFTPPAWLVRPREEVEQHPNQ